MVWDPKTIVLALTISATDKKSLQCAAVAGRGAGAMEIKVIPSVALQHRKMGYTFSHVAPRNGRVCDHFAPKGER